MATPIRSIGTSAFGFTGERRLRQQIKRKPFDRIELANLRAAPARAEPFAASNTSAAEVFIDLYFLAFLGLRQGHEESDLEAAILRELETFILELGRGLALVERQKRMVIEGEDFYLDLPSYHRRVHSLLGIELKLGNFKTAHKAQIELSLKWLNKHERQDGGEASIGLISAPNTAVSKLKLLQMYKDAITVAEYWNELPPMAEVEQHLR